MIQNYLSFIRIISNLPKHKFIASWEKEFWYLCISIKKTKNNYLLRDISRLKTTVNADVTTCTISEATSWLLWIGKPSNSKSKAHRCTNTLLSCKDAQSPWTWKINIYMYIISNMKLLKYRSKLILKWYI